MSEQEAYVQKLTEAKANEIREEAIKELQVSFDTIGLFCLCTRFLLTLVVTCIQNLAVIKAMKGEYDEAERLLRGALFAFPAHDRVMVKLGDLLMDERGNEEGARQLYRRAIDLNPTGADVLYSYGLFLLQVLYY